MEYFLTGALRRMGAVVLSLALIGTSAAMILAPKAGNASTQIALQQQPMIVRNDRGGLLRKRLNELRGLRSSNTPIEIRGAVCFSTCTMYLGLENMCVSPRTTFGFHGPSSYGRALDPATFNRASEIIADHYPAALRDWYMERGRFKIRTMYRIKGSEIIRMGVREC